MTVAVHSIMAWCDLRSIALARGCEGRRRPGACIPCSAPDQQQLPCLFATRWKRLVKPTIKRC